MVTNASQLTCPDIQLTDNDSRADCQKVNHFEQRIERKVLFTAQHSIKSSWVNVLSKRSLMNVIKQMSWTQTVFQDISNNPWCSSLRRFVCRVPQASNCNSSWTTSGRTLSIKKEWIMTLMPGYNHSLCIQYWLQACAWPVACVQASPLPQKGGRRLCTGYWPGRKLSWTELMSEHG